MRAGEVRQAIVDVIEAIAVDAGTRAGKRDTFRHVELGGREPGVLPERSFTVTLSAPPQLVPLYSEDNHRAEWVVRLHYVISEDVEDRIAQDAERVVARLHRLHEQDPDLFAVQLSALGITVDGSQIVNSYSVAPEYRADSIVAANSAA